jgi:hypothetical protein
VDPGPPADAGTEENVGVARQGREAAGLIAGERRVAPLDRLLLREEQSRKDHRSGESEGKAFEAHHCC